MKKLWNTFGKRVVTAMSLSVGLLLIVACHQHDSLPPFQDLNGKQISLSDLHGRWVLVNYWASWCHSCVEEVPILNQYARTHKDQVTLIGVSYDALPLEELKKTVLKMQIEYPVLRDNPAIAWKLQDAGVLPATYVFNPKGQLVATLLGPQTEKSLQNMTHLN